MDSAVLARRSTVAMEQADWVIPTWLILSITWLIHLGMLDTTFGLPIWIPGPSGTPPIQVNAQCLQTQVVSVTQKTKQPVILVAHSMGGLVSRACLNHTDCRNNIKSLYTLGSPHAGINSEFFVLLLAKFPVIAGAFCNVQAAVCQFTDAYMDTIFNPADPNQSGIDYRFIGGSKNPFPWGWLLRPLQGDNDRIIGKYSAVGWDYPLKIGSIEGSETRSLLEQ